MNELVVIDTWLATTLANDPTITAGAPGGVHDTTAPQGTLYPYVVHAYQPRQGGGDLNALGGRRVQTTARYLVKAVAATESYADVQALADRIDQLLQAARGTAAGGRILACVRVQPIKYPETANGLAYRHLGGMYEFQVQEA